MTKAPYAGRLTGTDRGRDAPAEAPLGLHDWPTAEEMMRLKNGRLEKSSHAGNAVRDRCLSLRADGFAEGAVIGWTLFAISPQEIRRPTVISLVAAANLRTCLEQLTVPLFTLLREQ